MDLVLVESPAKAKTIEKYLGEGYRVLATYGHVRDLSPKDGSVLPDDDFRMRWLVYPGSAKTLKAIADAVSTASRLYLATDPDREGEAISWHVLEFLEQRGVLHGIDVKRIVFHEVTRTAVMNAVKSPRELNGALVDAYLARRALDYLVGFTLSPVLWRKLPGAKSAGRVQSVALRLICERENEIEIFVPQEYWSVEADLRTADGSPVKARLTHLDGRKLGDHDIANEDAARAAVDAITNREFSVSAVECKVRKKRAAAPFTTSTLQQEASSKLGFGAARTMRTAQRLYEGASLGGETVGLISYMRTDSVNLSEDAVLAARAVIGNAYGHSYIPDKPNRHRSKARNAQEAHEAIRPTDFTRTPSDIGRHLPGDEAKLYRLIWQRAIASQMSAAVLERTAVDFASGDGAAVLRASGEVVKFDGFMRLYMEGSEEIRNPAGEDSVRILPPMTEGDAVKRDEVRPDQHFTKPSARYTEASLVKRLEELGIGRPSTYAPILQVLQDRDYVTLDKKSFVPNESGRLATAFLTGFFRRYVEYDFTADLEGRLDDVSNGEMEWKRLLEEFWVPFEAAVRDTEKLRVKDVIDRLDEDLGPHFFPSPDDGGDPRKCPLCADGRLGLKPSKRGGFIGCSNYPDCRFTNPLVVYRGGVDGAAVAEGPRHLGDDPETGLPVTLRNGPYGFYVQLGETEKGSKKKPKRQSLMTGTDPAAVDLDHALALLSLPREVGVHPDTGQVIVAGFSRVGPYLKHGDRYINLESGEEVLSIGLNRAVALCAEAPEKSRRPAAGKVIGDHPEDGKPIEVRDGRYGPYVRHGKVNASIPAGVDPASVTIDQAVELLANRVTSARNRGGAGRGRGRKATGTREATP